MFLQNANIPTKIIEDSTKIKDLTWDSINAIVATIVERLPYVLAGLLVLLTFWLLGKLVKSIFWTASGKTRLDSRLRILFSRLIVVFTIILGIFTALTVIIPGFTFGSLVTGLGFTTFIIGFATKDILNNLLSGVLILWQQPFRIGDYLFVGTNQGKVENIGVRATKLRKDDGELVLIPNGDMYSSAITIRGAGAERRMLLKISIGYESDIGQAKEIIGQVLRTSEGVVSEPKWSVVVTDLTGDGVNLSIYFWINTDKNKPLQVFDEVATQIKTNLGESGIEMFPPNSIIFQTPDKNSPPSEEYTNGEENTAAKKKEDFF
jgi:small conductance mechanosensitive channel